MTQMHVAVGDVLSSSGSARALIIKSVSNINFSGDDLIVMDAIKSLPVSFDFHDLAMKFKPEDRARLISLCMDANLNRINKEIVDDLRKTGQKEYIPIFKSSDVYPGLTQTAHKAVKQKI